MHTTLSQKSWAEFLCRRHSKRLQKSSKHLLLATLTILGDEPYNFSLPAGVFRFYRKAINQAFCKWWLNQNELHHSNSRDKIITEKSNDLPKDMWKLVWMLSSVWNCTVTVSGMVECRCWLVCLTTPIVHFGPHLCGTGTVMDTVECRCWPEYLSIWVADMGSIRWFYSGIFRNSLWLIEIEIDDLSLFSYKYCLVLCKRFSSHDLIAIVDWKIDFAYSAERNKKIFHHHSRRCRHHCYQYY